MRVLHTADLHFGKLIRGRSRRTESERIVDRLLQVVDETQPHLVIAAGDTFDTSRPGPSELYTHARLTSGLQKRGVPLAEGSGNHDGPTVMNDVRSKTAGWLAAMNLSGIFAFPEPHLELMTLDGIETVIFSLPFPHRRSFDDQLDKSLRDRTELVSKALEDSITAISEQLEYTAKDAMHLFMGHLSTINAQLSEEQAMRLGWDVTIRPDVLEGFEHSFLGHIHRPQKVTDGVYYAGSPWFGDFGESSQDKGFWLWDSDASTTTFHSSNPLPMVRIDVDETAPDAGWAERFEGYVQYRVPSTMSATSLRALRAQLRAAHVNAAGVWVERVKQKREVRARVAELASLSTPAAQVRMYLDSKGLPEAPFLARAMAIIGQVDGD